MRTALIYTAAIFVFLVALPSLLPVDLPQGWLSTLFG